ncbi:Pol polyprotein, partial [Mucuna pruriens]
MADTLATLSAMLQANQSKEMTIHVQHQTKMAHYQQVKEAGADGKPWYHDIREYLKKGAYPLRATENDKRTLRRLAASFFLSGTRMESDCCQHVRRCMKCQMYVDNIHIAPSTFHNITSTWPFSMWGLDMIGSIEPKASNGHKFILVAIDYFTKWVEVASYTVTKNVVTRFIKRDIICRYSLPTHIITNNGANLNNKLMIELCEQFKIKHHNSTPYHPKMNGAIKVANKNIKKIIQKMVVTYKDWHDMLTYALHRY